MQKLDHSKTAGGFCPTTRLANGLCPDDVNAWDFLDPSEYTYNQNYVEISGGLAKLKTVNTLHSGADFDRGTHVGTYMDSNSKISLLTKSMASRKVSEILSQHNASLLAYWRMDGDWSDESGSGHNGSAFDNATFSSDSQLGANSGKLDGTDDYVNIPTLTVTHLPEFSISVWVKPANVNDYQTVVSKEVNSVDRNIWLTIWNDGRAVMRTTSGGILSCNAAAAGDLRDGSWHHLVGVFSESECRIYVDSVLKDTDTGLGVPDGIGTNFNIGRQDAITTRDYEGNIDELAVWTTGISTEEVSSLYQGQLSNFTELSSSWTPHWGNLVGYWKMDGNWQDSSGNGFHATPSGGVIFDSDAKVGSMSGLFDGASYSSSSSVSVDPNDLSISGWVKGDAGSSSTFRAILSKGPKNTGHFELYKFNASNLLCFHAPDLTPNNICSNKELKDDEWTHIGLSLDGGFYKIYINGELDNSLSYTGTITSEAENLYIGRIVGRSYDWLGLLDDIALYSKSLSSSDMKIIYNRQKQKYSGHYVSPIIDIGASGSWTSLDAVTSLPFGKEIVSQYRESSSDYSSLGGDLNDGLINYWRFNEKNGTNGLDSVRDSKGIAHGTPSSVTFGEEGILNNAIYFDGTSSIEAPIDFEETQVLSVSFWLLWSEYTNDDRLALEFSPETNNSTTGFFINPSSGPPASGQFVVALRGDIGYSLGGFPRPSSGVWHHYTFIFDKSQAMGEEVKAYVDGVEQILNLPGGFNFDNTNTFSSSSLYFMSRAGGSLFGKGHMDEIAIWARPLNLEEIQQLYRRGANRIKYQVKSCIDSACNCKSFNSAPVGSVNDCDGDGIENDSDSDDIYRAEFIGPGGNGVTAYSELFNRSAGSLTFDCIANTTDSDNDICVEDEITLGGDTNASSPNFTFSDMATSAPPLNNRYFQYRVMMEAEENTACSGEPCLPELTRVEIGPTEKYYGASPVISSNSSLSYSSLSSITFSEGGSCSLTYQLSGDGSTYYYYNGIAWVTAESEDVSLSTNARSIQSNIANFPINSGNLYFKAFMTSDTSQACSLDDIAISTD